MIRLLNRLLEVVNSKEFKSGNDQYIENVYKPLVDLLIQFAKQSPEVHELKKHKKMIDYQLESLEGQLKNNEIIRKAIVKQLSQSMGIQITSEQMVNPAEEQMRNALEYTKEAANRCNTLLAIIEQAEMMHIIEPVKDKPNDNVLECSDGCDDCDGCIGDKEDDD